MCGVLLVQSRHSIDIDHHLVALKLLEPRGPDFVKYEHRNNIFIAQSVLNITGTPNFYSWDRKDFLAYNGEIYNYKWFGRFGTDTELVYQSVRDQPERKFKYFEGAWAWAYTNFETVKYATDPQGERCLYRYQDSDILIVSSDVAPILHYCNLGIDVKPYAEKHWPVRRATPWKGIERIEPGVMYTANGNAKLDSIFDWRKENNITTADQAWEEFLPLWEKTLREMTPEEPVGMAFSGGLDSSVILRNTRPAHLYTINIGERDPVAPRVREFLTEQEQQRLVMLELDVETWAQDYQDIVRRTCMPVQSWSFVGQWHIAKHCKERVLFTGVGADELFGGYQVYQTNKVSPYSKFAPDDAVAAQDWQQCLAMYNGDTQSATLLMDYLTQIGAVDMRGVDTLTMAHGIEPRSPFCHPNIIKFALNLPWDLRVGKQLIRRLFLQRWSEELILPKQGFTGYCNDAYAYLGIDIPRDPDRAQDWKNIVQATFANQFADQTIRV